MPTDMTPVPPLFLLFLGVSNFISVTRQSPTTWKPFEIDFIFRKDNGARRFIRKIIESKVYRLSINYG